MEQTFYTKDVEYKALQVSITQLPDDISHHIRAFLPCKNIMASVHSTKMAHFVAERSDAWILEHVPMFETIHRRNYTEMIEFLRKQGNYADIAWFRDNICRFKKNRKYITCTRAIGHSQKLLLVDAAKFLRKLAFDYYSKKANPL
jgi:hypothetical protein